MALLDRFRLDGKVAIVTAASRGIGKASAVALAECGADVVIAARTTADLDAVAGTISEIGRRAALVTCDLSDVANMRLLTETAMTELGGVDIVVNNVGGTMPAPLLDTPTKTIEAAFHFNVATAYELTQCAVPHMLERGSGSIINITSTMGRLSDRGYAAYGTAKGALAHLTRLLAADLAPRIRVNAIAPGSIETDSLASVLNDELRTLMIAGTPLRRLGTVEDIALGIVYLASEAGSFLTGKVLEIDGGLTFPNLSLRLPDL
ncbi:MAG TPA: SDR family oxidoreductase [Acidimicrobiales bacterium]|nr:SDR family oxidoreductase [Acidimicrobiales bacterium]